MARPVKPVTSLFRQGFILGITSRLGPCMLLLTAILRVSASREPEANDLLAEARSRIGHLGLTVIALVYILVTFWQR